MSIRLTIAILLSLILSGCLQKVPLGNPQQPYPLERTQVGDLLHLATGHLITPSELRSAIGDTRVIFVGETHDNPASHRFQLEILQGLAQKNPGKLALAMEMFTPEQQPILERWSRNELSEKDFLRQVDWFKHWRMNFQLYRPLLNFCRLNQIPLIALNAPKALSRKLGRTPLAELPAELQAELPELDFSDPYQQALTNSIYGAHSMGQAMNDGFIRVQTLWDESMAQNLANYLLSPAGQGRQVMVIAGGNHIRYGFGIPRRLHRRLPVSYLLLGSQEIEIPKEREAQLMDVDMPQFPMRAWDYLKLTSYEKSTLGVKLGVVIADAEGQAGLLIKLVMPGSAAEKAGIQPGDFLLRAADTVLNERFELLYLLMNLQAGDKLQLELQRDTERLRVVVAFPAS